jgi:hypothetical protein
MTTKGLLSRLPTKYSPAAMNNVGGRAVRATVMSLLAFAPVALSAGTAIAAESLPFTTMTPEDGAVVTQTAYGNVQWIVTGGPKDAYSISVRLSQTPDVGTDGQTLSDLHTVGLVGLGQSTTDVGVFRGASVPGPSTWTNYPGTYYWQASASWTETIPDDPNTPIYDPKYVSHSALSQIRRIVVQAPQAPQAPAPTPQPQPTTSPLQMTAYQARYYTRTFIRQRTHRRPTALWYGCSRLSTRSFRCLPSWRDSRYSYRGTAQFRHFFGSDSKVYASARFDGRRARNSCLKGRSFSSCATAVHWR